MLGYLLAVPAGIGALLFAALGGDVMGAVKEAQKEPGHYPYNSPADKQKALQNDLFTGACCTAFAGALSSLPFLPVWVRIATALVSAWIWKSLYDHPVFGESLDEL